MARAHVVLVASFLAATRTLSYALAVPPQPEFLQGSLIRRHGKDDLAFSLSPTGHIGAGKSDTSYNPLTNRNLDWPLALTTDRNSCSGGGSFISEPAICERAANDLGYTYNGSYDWSTIVVTSGMVIVPENCFVENSIVHYNSQISDTRAKDGHGSFSFIGVQICQRPKYIDGKETVQSNVANVCSVANAPDADYQSLNPHPFWCTNPPDCTNPDYEAITGSNAAADYAACRDAADRMTGPEWCRMEEFRENATIALGDRPKGCFRNSGKAGNGLSQNGCFGYNTHMAGGGTTLIGRPVCRLKQSVKTANAQRVAAAR